MYKDLHIVNVSGTVYSFEASRSVNRLWCAT